MLASRYDAGFLILEEGAVTDGLMPIFDNLGSQNIILIGEVEGAKIFVIETE